MKLTRILLLLGILSLGVEYILNFGALQTSRGVGVGRWVLSNEDEAKPSDNPSNNSSNNFSDRSSDEADADASTSAATRTAAPKSPSSALNTPGEDFDFSSYLKNGRVTIVYFYADWCPACRQMSPVLANINREDPDKQVVFLDIEEWNSPIADRYGIKYVPYLQIYDPRGSLVLEGRAASNWVWEPGTRRPLR